MKKENWVQIRETLDKIGRVGMSALDWDRLEVDKSSMYIKQKS